MEEKETVEGKTWDLYLNTYVSAHCLKLCYRGKCSDTKVFGSTKMWRYCPCRAISTNLLACRGRAAMICVTALKTPTLGSQMPVDSLGIHATTVCILQSLKHVWQIRVQVVPCLGPAQREREILVQNNTLATPWSEIYLVLILVEYLLSKMSCFFLSCNYSIRASRRSHRRCQGNCGPQRYESQCL